MGSSANDIGNLAAENGHDPVAAADPSQARQSKAKHEDTSPALEDNEDNEISPADVRCEEEETENPLAARAAGVEGDDAEAVSAARPRGSEEPGDELIRPADLVGSSHMGSEIEEISPSGDKMVRKGDGFAENNAAAAAASIGHVPNFEEAVSSNPILLNERFRWGWTIGHVAAACGQEMIIEAIYKRDANILVKANDVGQVPMHYAAANGQSLALYMLLKYVPDSANARCADGRTPLEMAKYGMCRKLLQNHAHEVAARKAKEIDLRTLVEEHKRRMAERERRRARGKALSCIDGIKSCFGIKLANDVVAGAAGNRSRFASKNSRNSRRSGATGDDSGVRMEDEENARESQEVMLNRGTSDVEGSQRSKKSSLSERVKLPPDEHTRDASPSKGPVESLRRPFRFIEDPPSEHGTAKSNKSDTPKDIPDLFPRPIGRVRLPSDVKSFGLEIFTHGLTDTGESAGASTPESWCGGTPKHHHHSAAGGASRSSSRSPVGRSASPLRSLSPLRPTNRLPLTESTESGPIQSEEI